MVILKPQTEDNIVCVVDNKTHIMEEKYELCNLTDLTFELKKPLHGTRRINVSIKKDFKERKKNKNELDQFDDCFFSSVYML